MRWRRTKNKLRRRDMALRLLGGVPPGRVLDAPCGAGLLVQELVEAGHEVWACDVDPGALAHREGVHFDAIDLDGRLPYADGFFDAVVSLEGIEHLAAPAVCLAEFARVLRPGGVLVLSTPNVNNVQSRCHYFLRGRFSGFRRIAHRALDDGARLDRSHVTVPYLPTLVLLTARSGLRMTSVEVTLIKPKQWLLVPVALPMWLSGCWAPIGSLARLLGSWRMLLGRSVIVSAVKDGLSRMPLLLLDGLVWPS